MSPSLLSVSSKESRRRHSRISPPLPPNSICEFVLKLHSGWVGCYLFLLASEAANETEHWWHYLNVVFVA